MSFALVPKPDGYYALPENVLRAPLIDDDLNYLLCADSYRIELEYGGWTLRSQVLVTRLLEAAST